MVGHPLALHLPLGPQAGVAQDGRHEACAVDGRVAVHGSDQNLELRQDARRLVGVRTHDAQGADALA